MTENLPEQKATVPALTVKVERSVQINRLLIVGVLLGAVISVLITTLFPVVPEGQYTMVQIAGFMALIGAGIGLLLAAVLALVLTQIAKQKKGHATVVQSDVQ